MQQVLELQHWIRELPGGGFVLVLNTGAVITPEAEAMLQALHSRSVGGINAHLHKLAEKGPEKFMESFYVQYGHKSIGDCGTGTIFIEGVSMLAAKAIQDWQLYSGQEASTRYIDFSTQKFIDPLGSSQSNQYLEVWREFYLSAQEQVQQHLKELFPRGEGEKQEVYDKAIKARCFDILRGFLPAGASTNLSWHTNLRQTADKLACLRHHPLKEVHDIAEAIESVLNEAFPSSFGHKRYEATEEYLDFWMNNGYLFKGLHDRRNESSGVVAFPSSNLKVTLDSGFIDNPLLHEQYGLFLQRRPPKTELPKQMGECGTMQFKFLIDFGSYRDIQRHRAVIQRMPLLTKKFGMHPWYLDSLPVNLRETAVGMLLKQFKRIDKWSVGEGILQYYLPMGLCVPCRLTGDLPALVYLVELRAQKTVHPTLHAVALEMADLMLERLGRFGLTLFVDREQGRFDIKRGLQDIVEKK